MHASTTRWDKLTRQRQHHRILQLSFVNDDAPDAELLINRLEASEALSRDYAYTLELLSNDAGELVRAYCVDISHTAADPAGNFWIGWSNVQWTKTLIKKVSEAGWRRFIFS
jgi:hypothetical protein